MVRIKNPYDFYEEYDGCGNEVFAVLEVDKIKIPLCQECFESLVKEVNSYNTPQFCFQCEHWGMNRWGVKYGGSCMKDGKIDPQLWGYRNNTSWLDSCNKFKEKKNERTET